MLFTMCKVGQCIQKTLGTQMKAFMKNQHIMYFLCSKMTIHYINYVGIIKIFSRMAHICFFSFDTSE